MENPIAEVIREVVVVPIESFKDQESWAAYATPRSDEPLEHDADMKCWFAWKEGTCIGCWNEEEQSGYCNS